MAQLRTTRTVYTARDFISWQKAKTLKLSPSFQRRPVWPQLAKSFLIDTIARGLPIPIIFIRETSTLSDLEPKREVVDGQQRLRTLIAFVAPELLSDYQPGKDDFLVSEEHNAELADKRFPELTAEWQRRILDYEFSTHVLPPETADPEVLQIFARMNATGTKLNEQELRNAEFFGRFKTTMYALAYEQLERWRTWNIFNENEIARMEEVEMTSELVMLMLLGLQGKTQKRINKVYKDKDKAKKFPERGEASKRFRKVMDSIDEQIGRALRDLIWSRKAMFFSLFSYTYDCIYDLEQPFQKGTSPKKLPRDFAARIKRTSARVKSQNIPEDVADAMGRATSDLARRNKRLEFLQQG